MINHPDHLAFVLEKFIDAKQVNSANPKYSIEIEEEITVDGYNSNNNQKYYLYSIVEHLGSNLNFGHAIKYF